VYLDFGLNYLLQQTGNNVSNYALTGKVGTYTSLAAGEHTLTQQTISFNLGARFYFNKRTDSDGDGILDRNDKCPTVAGLRKFEGCPDSDEDGIPDQADSCPKEFGLVQFHGCPDSDGDGIPDKYDRCPKQAGPSSLNGCPDSDGDGIPDIDDKCPHEAGLPQFGGCPDTDGDGIPDYEDNCPTVPGVKEYHGCPVPATAPVEKEMPPVPDGGKKREVTLVEDMTNQPAPVTVKDLYTLGAPILFGSNSFEVKDTSKSTIKLAVDELKHDPSTRVKVDAYTDATGSDEHNDALSKKRAEAVKSELVKMGADASRISAVGHGKKDPVASNHTPEGREKNRRTILSMEKK
jgi:OmpA-OmpF porin, OOP family